MKQLRYFVIFVFLLVLTSLSYSDQRSGHDLTTSNSESTGEANMKIDSYFDCYEDEIVAEYSDLAKKIKEGHYSRRELRKISRYIDEADTSFLNEYHKIVKDESRVEIK